MNPIRAGKLTAKNANRNVSKWESPLELGDGLSQTYQNVLKNLKKQKAKKTYCAPDDDILVVGSARK